MATRAPLTDKERRYIQNQYRVRGSGFLAERLGCDRATVWAAARDLGLTGVNPPDGYTPLIEATIDFQCTEQALYCRAHHAAITNKDVMRVHNGRAYLRTSWLQQIAPSYDDRRAGREALEAGYLTITAAARELGVRTSRLRTGLKGDGEYAALAKVRQARGGKPGHYLTLLLHPHDVTAVGRTVRATRAALHRTHEPLRDLQADLPHVPRRTLNGMLRSRKGEGLTTLGFLGTYEALWIRKDFATYLRNHYASDRYEAASAARKKAA